MAALATRSAQLGGDDPAPLFRESIGRLHALGLKAFTGWALIGLAGWWADHEQIEPAAHVIGFLDANEPGGNQTYAAVRNQASDTVQRAPNAGPWISAGGRMTRDEIVVYCLERLSPRR